MDVMETNIVELAKEKAEKMTTEEKMQVVATFMLMEKPERLQYFGFDKQYKLAEVLGITQKTLSIWKNKSPKYKKIQQKVLIEMNIERHLPRILRRLVERAEVDGDVNAIKEILKLTDLSKEKLEIISDQRIHEILEQVVTILKEEIKDPALLNRIAERLEKLDV